MAKGEINDPIYYNFSDGNSSSVIYAIGAGEVNATTLRIVQSADAINSTNVTQYGGDNVAKGTELSNGFLRVYQAADISNSVNVTNSSLAVTGPLTNTELRASALEVFQVSGSAWSTNVLTMPSVVVSSITASTAASIVDSSGAQYSGSNPLPTKEGRASTATLSNVASSASSVTLLASNSNRLGVKIYNDSTQILYAKFGSTATSSSYTVKMFPEDLFEDSVYTGVIDGVWASANGSARVTELTL